MSASILEPAASARSTQASRPARSRWIGRSLSAIAVLFLTFDVAIKLAGSAMAVEGTTQLGFAPEHVFVIGLIELGCLILYLVPRTAPLGAVLWTGYLGGAIATHLRLYNPLFSHTLFPIYVAVLLWGGLYLRDARVRALVQRHR